MPLPKDTTTDARQAQVAAYRRMTPAARVAVAARMSEEARAIALSGIQRRHPELSPADARKVLLRTLLGEALYLKSRIHERG